MEEFLVIFLRHEVWWNKGRIAENLGVYTIIFHCIMPENSPKLKTNNEDNDNLCCKRQRHL